MTGVRFHFINDFEISPGTVVFVQQTHPCAKRNLVAAEFVDVDDIGSGEFVFQLRDVALIETLRLLGGVVFRVFGEVAVRSGFLNRLDNLGTLNGPKSMEFLLKGGAPFGRHGNSVHIFYFVFYLVIRDRLF